MRLRQKSICCVPLRAVTLNVALLRLAPRSSRALHMELFAKPLGFLKNILANDFEVRSVASEEERGGVAELRRTSDDEGNAEMAQKRAP